MSAINPGGLQYNVLFKSTGGSTVGDDSLNYYYDVSQPFLAVGGALLSDEGRVQIGGGAGKGTLSANQLFIASQETINFHFPTADVYLDTLGNLSTTGNIVALQGGQSIPQFTSQSSVQLFSSPTGVQNNIVFHDATRTANNKIAAMLWQNQSLTLGFVNDAWSNTAAAIAISGGNAANVTGIASNSGTGRWVHTGSMSIGAISRGKLAVGDGASSLTTTGADQGILMTKAVGAGFNRFYMENLNSVAGQRVFAWDNSNGALSLSSYTDIGTGTVFGSIISFGYDGLTTHGGKQLVATGSTFANPMSTLQSVGNSGNFPVLSFYSSNGPDANRKKWYITSKNGNFFSMGISDDAGANNFDGYQIYRGNGTIGGHQWFLGAAGVTTGTATPTMSLTNNNAFSLSAGISAVIGGTIPNAASVLQLISTTKGFLPPVMTEAQKRAIVNPPDGLLVYVTDGTSIGLQLRFISAWHLITVGSAITPDEPEI